jgi:hypothetical protein
MEIATNVKAIEALSHQTLLELATKGIKESQYIFYIYTSYLQ